VNREVFDGRIHYSNVSTDPHGTRWLNVDYPTREAADRAAEILTRHGWTVTEHGSERDIDGRPPATVGPYFVLAIKDQV
jgi:hypothetical protein